jgi:hypothetical protein
MKIRVREYFIRIYLHHTVARRVISRKFTLLVYPADVYPADGIDWTKFSGGSLSYHMIDMSTFAHA